MFGIQKSSTSKMLTLTHRLKTRKLSFEKPPLEIFSKLYSNYENAYILESIEGPKKLSQYSFIGFDPTLTITIKNGEVQGTKIHRRSCRIYLLRCGSTLGKTA